MVLLLHVLTLGTFSCFLQNRTWFPLHRRERVMAVLAAHVNTRTPTLKPCVKVCQAKAFLQSPCPQTELSDPCHTVLEFLVTDQVIRRACTGTSPWHSMFRQPAPALHRPAPALYLTLITPSCLPSPELPSPKTVTSLHPGYCVSSSQIWFMLCVPHTKLKRKERKDKKRKRKKRHL